MAATYSNISLEPPVWIYGISLDLPIEKGSMINIEESIV